MHRRHSSATDLPKIWLMTDERMGDGVLSAVAQLRPGSGIVFRHYSLVAPQRRELFDQVRKIARRRRLILILAGSENLARSWKARGAHGPPRHRSTLLRTIPVHDVRDVIAANRAKADAIFLSPVYATRSHPGQLPLGRVRFGQLARQARTPVIALGGMTKARARSMAVFGISGWAAIDAFTLDQKRPG
jgi:thiamine-phosphate pyrophosphorylase